MLPLCYRKETEAQRSNLPEITNLSSGVRIQI